MDTTKTENRTLIIKLRISPTEKQRLQQLRSQTTERSLSNYLRKLGLQKPVIIRYRNDSADDFLRDMAALNKQLSGIANNFNQVVHKLHTLDRIPDFRNWIQEQQQQHRQIIGAIEQIRSRINQLYEQWLQK